MTASTLSATVLARDGARLPAAEADLVDPAAESPAAGFVSKSELSAEAIRRIVGG